MERKGLNEGVLYIYMIRYGAAEREKVKGYSWAGLLPLGELWVWTENCIWSFGRMDKSSVSSM